MSFEFDVLSEILIVLDKEFFFCLYRLVEMGRMNFQEEEKKVLTVGTLGHPNVGKSSLINSLLGKIQVN